MEGDGQAGGDFLPCGARSVDAAASGDVPDDLVGCGSASQGVTTVLVPYPGVLLMGME